MVPTAFERRLFGALLLDLFIQAVLFSFVLVFFPVPRFWIGLFYPVLLLYHLALWFILLSQRDQFLGLDGTPLTRVGWPNLLTLFRLTSLPSMTVLFLLARAQPRLSIPLVVFVSIVFITDLLDGFLARTFKMGTRLGKLLDSSSDYLILVTLTVVLAVSGVLDLWLVCLILVRLGIQIVGMVWITMRFKRHFPETTFLGKVSLFVLMVLYAVEILVFLRLPFLEENWWVEAFEIFSGAIMVISSVDKLLFFQRKFKTSETETP